MKFKPQKQFMVSSIEQNSLSLASSLLRIESFVRFLEELRTPKFTFEIVWPLVVCYIFHKLISSIIKLNNMKYMKSFHNSKLRVKGKWDLPFWELQSLQLRGCENSIVDCWLFWCDDKRIHDYKWEKSETYLLRNVLLLLVTP